MSDLPPAVRDLVDALCDERATAADLTALEERLAHDPALTPAVLARLGLEADLRAANRRLGFAARWTERLHQERTRHHIMTAITAHESARWQRAGSTLRRPRVRHLEHRPATRRRTAPRRRRGPATVAPVLAVAAGLVAVVALVLAGIGGDEIGSPTPAATIVVVLDGAATVDGQQLAPGRHHLAPGATLTAAGVHLNLADGSRLRLDGRLRLPPRAAGARWHAHAGTVACTIAHRGPGDPPFELHTAHGEVRVIGTRFTLSVHADHSLVRVHEGRVGVRDAAGRRELGPGDEARLGAAPRPRAADPDPATATTSWRTLLVDAASGAVVRELQPDDTISLSAFGDEGFNLEFRPPPEVTALRFAVNGGQPGDYPGGTRGTNTEFEPPLMLYGDSGFGARVNGYRPAPGPFTVRAIGYRERPGREVVGVHVLRLTVAP